MKRKSLLYFASSRPDYTQIGEIPSMFFYGTDQFREDPSFLFKSCWKRNIIFRLFWKLFECYGIYRTGIGFRLDQALFHLVVLRKQDVIIAETDSCGLPLLLLKRLHLLRARVGFNSAGLINSLQKQEGTYLFKFYSWLLTVADFIVCWSPLEEKLYKDLTGARARFVLLEADTAVYQPDFSVPLEEFILCVGNDIGRDFETLFHAVEMLDIRTVVVTKSARVKGMTIPTNVELHLEYVDFPTLLGWYKKARLVIVNLQEIHRFTGQRALLESLAMGKATIAAKTQALISTYPLIENQQVIFYRPGNVLDLKEKIEQVFENEEQLIGIGRRARFFVESLPKNSYYLKVKQLIETGT